MYFPEDNKDMFLCLCLFISSLFSSLFSFLFFYYLSLSFFPSFLVGLSFELTKHSTASVTPPVPFAQVILEIGSLNFFPWVTLNHYPTDLSLPNS
jgi:hypothetical protein